MAAALEELGDLYELDGAIVHRVLAYRSAARSVREASVSVASLARAGRVTELQGLGKTLEEKILALLDTGTIPAAERLKARFPAGLVEITRLPGIGAKRARKLHDELGIDSPQALRDAALAQRLRGVKGFGPKFEQSVLQTLQERDVKGGGDVLSIRRVTLPPALEVAQALAAGLQERGPADAQVLVAGSIRRQVEAVKDIDLIAVTQHPQELAQVLGQLEQIESVSSAGVAGARARTHFGLPVDLRIAAPTQLGNLLQHFSGSGRHNAALREAAVKLGLHVSEYGIEDAKTGGSRTCLTEEEVYTALRRAWIAPELREDRGEIAASLLESRNGGLPQLIEESDIKGDLHCHTVASDGHASIEEMAAAAMQRGYRYLAITDHSASHGFGNAVSPDQLRRQIERVRECDAKLDGFKLLCGSEVNVLPDGSLDYEDELLSQLDWVIASVHTAFGIGEQEMTKRIITAIEHPLVDAIGHPTGRLIERREPYAVDIEQVIAAAAETKTMLEINANPDRRDLSELHARAAAEAGVTLVIDSDAHWPATLANMRWGVATARRAWLTKAQVANTRTWPQLQRLRKPSARRA
ncbi:MAG TPA: DNA polymerase/3'-5' exonuclease PolX [Solirubrobacteraceae bacterium]